MCLTPGQFLLSKASMGTKEDDKNTAWDVKVGKEGCTNTYIERGKYVLGVLPR